MDYIADFLFRHPCVISRQTYVVEKQRETFIRGKYFEPEETSGRLELNMGFQNAREASESPEDEFQVALAPVKFLPRQKQCSLESSAISKLSISSMTTQTRVDHEFTVPGLGNDLLVDDGNI